MRIIYTLDDFGYQFEPVELYDMEADPYQTWNIRDERPDIVQSCSHYLAEWTHKQTLKGHCIPDPLTEILREREKRSYG
jgi:hypothetical protein